VPLQSRYRLYPPTSILSPGNVGRGTGDAVDAITGDVVVGSTVLGVAEFTHPIKVTLNIANSAVR
jgi:hypothetical protein